MAYNTDWQGVASSASAARPAHESIVFNLNERRTAWDGEAYALEEFAEFYGFASGLAIWQQSECQDSAEQPVGITARPKAFGQDRKLSNNYAPELRKQ